MQVDRTQFLLLAASMAAGCVAQTPVADAPVTVATPIEVEPATGEEGLVIAEEENVEPVDRSGTQVAAGDDLVQICRGLQAPPGPYCESFEDTKIDCERFASALEPEAAEAATRCLADASGSEAICRFEATEDCFVAGLRAARPDGSARRQCEGVAQQCSTGRWSSPDMSVSSCELAMAAVKSQYEAQLIACMVEGCGIASCVWVLGDR